MNLNITNFRDVSGYVNRYGQVMKNGCIFRGGPLDSLSAEEVEYMEEQLGIRYIFDYRDEKEAELAPDAAFSKACYKRIGALQLKENTEKGFDFGAMLQGNMTKEKAVFLMEYLMEGYRQMPFQNPAYQELFEALLENKGNVYFHCSAGKDRTGISAFLIMMALGVSEEDGIREYLFSNEYLKEGKEALKKEWNLSDEMMQLCEPLLGVSEVYIRTAIDAIKSRYQDYDEFLEKEYGLDEKKRQILRTLYCEEK